MIGGRVELDSPATRRSLVEGKETRAKSRRCCRT